MRGEREHPVVRAGRVLTAASLLVGSACTSWEKLVRTGESPLASTFEVTDAPLTGFAVKSAIQSEFGMDVEVPSLLGGNEWIPIKDGDTTISSGRVTHKDIFGEDEGLLAACVLKEGKGQECGLYDIDNLLQTKPFTIAGKTWERVDGLRPIKGDEFQSLFIPELSYNKVEDRLELSADKDGVELTYQSVDGEILLGGLVSIKVVRGGRESVVQVKRDTVESEGDLAAIVNWFRDTLASSRVRVVLAAEEQPTPTLEPTPEPTPTPDPVKEKVQNVFSQEDLWLAAGVPKDVWGRWAAQVETGEISFDLETFVAQAWIVQKLHNEGKIQSPTSLEKIDPAGLNYQVGFVDSESGKLPIVYLVDKDGAKFISALNKPIDQAGFPDLQFKKTVYTTLFQVPNLAGLEYQLVNFNQAVYTDPTGKMPAILMTPQDLYTDPDRLYSNGLWGCQEDHDYCSYVEWTSGNMGGAFSSEIRKKLTVGPERPAVAIYVPQGVDPRTAQKIIGLEYAQAGQENDLIRTVKIVAEINSLLAREELKELRRFFVKELVGFPMLTTFWNPWYLSAVEDERTAYIHTALRSQYEHSWSSATIVIFGLSQKMTRGRYSLREVAVNCLAWGPYKEIEVNGKEPQSLASFNKITADTTLESLIDQAKKNGEIDLIHFVYWIYEQLESSD